MSNLEDKLTGILSDPEAVGKLKALGEALGLDTQGGLPQSPKPREAPPRESTTAQGFNLPFLNQGSDKDEMISTLMRLAPLLSDMGRDDEATCLLNSLSPFLSEPRRKRLEQAQKMLKVMRLLPVIRSTGLL